MNEHKRFELIPMCNKNDIWYGVFDNLENEYVTDKLCDDSEKVCDKLNELNDENEQLKEQLLDANELKGIYVDFLVDKGFEFSDVVEWSKRS